MKMQKMSGDPKFKKTFNYMFLLDGTRVKTILDIPSDAQVLIATEKPFFMGVEFEEVSYLQAQEREPLIDLVVKKSSKFSNTMP